MKAKGFRKFFMSIALSTVLTFSTAASAFAATAQLQTAGQEAELSLDDASDIPAVDSSDAQAAGTSYLVAQSGIKQIAASTSSLTVQWDPVTNAAKYAISISFFPSSSYKLLGYFDNTRNKATINKLKAGTAYNVKLTAINSSGTAITSRTVGCTTLYTSVNVKSSYASGNGYTFNMDTVNPANSITGYKVVYQSASAKKSAVKYFTRYSFTLPMSGSSFYQVKIYPYIVLNNKRYVSPSATTSYVSTGVVLQKAGNTNTSMSVKWNKISGAVNYSIYIRYPGSTSFKKVQTTSSNSFRLNGMKRNYKYGIKVIANKIVNNKIWYSYARVYNMSLV